MNSGLRNASRLKGRQSVKSSR